MKRSIIGLITAMIVTASVGQAANLKIENGPFSITCTGVLDTRNGIYFFNQEKSITALTPDDEFACWGASILPRDKGCWPMRGKSIEQILAVWKDVSGGVNPHHFAMTEFTSVQQ
jgi:hypothetical protein